MDGFAASVGRVQGATVEQRALSAVEDALARSLVRRAVSPGPPLDVDLEGVGHDRVFTEDDGDGVVLAEATLRLSLRSRPGCEASAVVWGAWSAETRTATASLAARREVVEAALRSAVERALDALQEVEACR